MWFQIEEIENGWMISDSEDGKHYFKKFGDLVEHMKRHVAGEIVAEE